MAATRARAFRSFDGWYRFTAAMAPAALERAAERAEVPHGGLVIDPFAGSGRTATYITGRGDRFVGIEAHPLLAELCQVKLDRPGRPAELRELSENLTSGLSARCEVATEHELLRRCVPARQLAELAQLRDAGRQTENPWGGHFVWSVLGALRDLSAAGWTYGGARSVVRQQRSATEVVTARVAQMADDLTVAPRAPSAKVVAGDARNDQAWKSIRPGSVHASISSPPYLNQLAYAEVLRTELYFLGLASTWAELRALGSDLMTSCTQQLTRDRRRAALEVLEALPATQVALRSVAHRLRSAQAQRTRSKPYDRLLLTYMADMARVMLRLRTALVPGGKASWVIGDSAPYRVWVDTPSLLGLLASELGFEVEVDEVLRARGGRWPRRNGHGHPLSERLLVFRKPGWQAQAQLPGFEDA